MSQTPQVAVSIRVLGEELTRAEAEALYRQLGDALGKSETLTPLRPWAPGWDKVGDTSKWVDPRDALDVRFTVGDYGREPSVTA